MAKVQKTYMVEFKREAVRLAQTSGKPIAQVARELGISDTSSINGVSSWQRTAPKRFLAVRIRPLKKRKSAASNANWKS